MATGSSPRTELAAALHRLRSTLARLKAELELAEADGTTPPTDASMLPVLPGSGERDHLRERNVALPDRGRGAGPLNAPSQASRSFSA